MTQEDRPGYLDLRVEPNAVARDYVIAAIRIRLAKGKDRPAGGADHEDEKEVGNPRDSGCTRHKVGTSARTWPL